MSKPKAYLAFEKLAKGLFAVPQDEYRKEVALHDKKKRERPGESNRTAAGRPTKKG